MPAASISARVMTVICAGAVSASCGVRVAVTTTLFNAVIAVEFSGGCAVSAERLAEHSAEIARGRTAWREEKSGRTKDSVFIKKFRKSGKRPRIPRESSCTTNCTAHTVMDDSENEYHHGARPVSGLIGWTKPMRFISLGAPFPDKSHPVDRAPTYPITVAGAVRECSCLQIDAAVGITRFPFNFGDSPINSPKHLARSRLYAVAVGKFCFCVI